MARRVGTLAQHCLTASLADGNAALPLVAARPGVRAAATLAGLDWSEDIWNRLIEALKVGCLIEEKDIQDINDKKKLVIDEPDIVQVYDHLLCGSRNHLRAFNGALLDQGVSYEATVLTQAEWDAIASSAQETCGG